MRQGGKVFRAFVGSAGVAGEHAEEGFYVGVGADIAIAIEVINPATELAPWGAVACDAAEERLNISVGAGVTITVDVGGAAGEGDVCAEEEVVVGEGGPRG